MTARVPRTVERRRGFIRKADEEEEVEAEAEAEVKNTLRLQQL
jgi:hypothetical protein